MIIFTETSPNGLEVQRVTQVGADAFIALVKGLPLGLTKVVADKLQFVTTEDAWLEVTPYHRVKSVRIFRGEKDENGNADLVVERLRGLPFVGTATPDWKEFERG